MKGHIQLGVTGDLRDYLLIDPMQYHASPANPMAPRLNTGEKFAELTGWAEWVQADWPGGVGRSDPNANGYLYGDLDSRVAGQLILPPALGATIGYAVESDFLKKNRGLFMPTDATGFTTVTLTPAGDAAMNTYIYGQIGNISTGAGVYIRMSDGATVILRLWDGTAYRTTATLTGTGDPFFAWHWAEWAAPFTLVATGNHAIDIECTAGTAEVVCGYGYPNYATGTYDGAWTSQTYAPLLVTDWYSTADSIANYTSFLRTPLRLLAVAEKTSPHSLFLASYNVDSDVFGLTTAFTSRTTDLTIASGTTTYNGTLQLIDTKTIDVADGAILKITDQLTSIAITSETMYQGTPAVQFDAHTYIPVGDGFGKIDADGNGTTETPDASLFTAWAGYLWRATGNDLYYSADGSTWTGPIAIGGDDYRVRGLAGLERTVYAATDEGLFYVGDGDITIGITPWGTLTNEELRAINYEGAILVPVAGRVLRYTADGTMIDVWVQRADDLPADKLGAPALLAAMNQWLLAAINPGTAGGSATVWMWQTEGWHPALTLPPGINIKSIYYDRTLSRLWVGCDHGLSFWQHIDDYAMNPYNSADSRYMPYGWMETPRFYGDLKKIDKDFESVFLTGDFPTGTTASIYYQSDQDATWTILGTVSGDNTEIRWSDYATRPTGKWIKLGLLLATEDPTVTPRIKAIVVKYMPMTMDRERWQLPILIAQEQEMLDGTQDVQTQAQKLAHVRSIIRRVAPFTFVDLDGTAYQVKVVGSNRSVYQYSSRPGAGDAIVDWIITLSLEQLY